MRKTKKLTMAGMLMALVVALTAITKIPIPNGGGAYVHLGDAPILLAGVLLGPFYGAAIGGLASSLADILAGAPQFAVPTLLVKGFMGLAVGLLASTKKAFWGKDFLAMLSGSLVMVGGYYITYAFMYYGGNLIAPAASIWMDFAQALCGVLISFMLLPIMKKIKEKNV